ncbi:hypothetical protein QCA50_019584 [Cerrena zonata]|uniref:Maturase K n=1 Tax=Cerrena zonata TaxID=2478898 RepID=A0AAW0FAN2_9APHY
MPEVFELVLLQSASGFSYRRDEHLDALLYVLPQSLAQLLSIRWKRYFSSKPESPPGSKITTFKTYRQFILKSKHRLVPTILAVPTLGELGGRR